MEELSSLHPPGPTGLPSETLGATSTKRDVGAALARAPPPQLRSQKNPSSGGPRFHLQVQPSSGADFLHADGGEHQGFQAPTAQPTVDGERQL